MILAGDIVFPVDEDIQLDKSLFPDVPPGAATDFPLTTFH